MEVSKKRKKGKKNNKIKEIFNKIKDKFLEIYKPYFLHMALPFVLMEIFILLFSLKVSYVNYKFISPILFSVSWIVLFVGLSLNLKKRIGKLIYIIIDIIFLFLFLVNNVYFSMTKNFFDFSLIESAGEGAPYILDAVKNCNVLVYFAFAILIFSSIWAFKKLPQIESNNYKGILKIIIVFLILHNVAVFSLGKANVDLTWSSWRNPRNIYNSFNDNNKSIKVSGFVEYSIRNFYVTFLKTQEQESAEDLEFLDSAYAYKKSTKNDYTAKLKGKNLIIVQLEGLDKWLLNKNDTPTLYKLMNEGLNFDKHFSFYTGGGSTFNSEFAVNTGYNTPLSYTKNVYSFNKNNFPNTLAKIFKNEGYTVNAFHMNTGEYYSRTVNYKSWGYDNYYGLIDVNKYTDKSYMLDRELILNEKFDGLLYPTENKFLDYIIAYSSHMPFDNKEGVCKLLYELDNQQKKLDGEEIEFVQMSEEECARRQAKETDYMIQLLINKLEEKKLTDSTALIIFTDHYLYTLNDQSILAKYKNTSNNLINLTPWFVWSKGLKSKKITKVTSQLNILPTILNLYGVTYSVNDYIGQDALSKNYMEIAFFSDYSWYDGNVYVEGGMVKNGKKISNEKLEEKNEYVSYLSKKNDLTLKYNYFKKESSE